MLEQKGKTTLDITEIAFDYTESLVEDDYRSYSRKKE